MSCALSWFFTRLYPTFFVTVISGKVGVFLSWDFYVNFVTIKKTGRSGYIGQNLGVVLCNIIISLILKYSRRCDKKLVSLQSHKPSVKFASVYKRRISYTPPLIW